MRYPFLTFCITALLFSIRTLAQKPTFITHPEDLNFKSDQKFLFKIPMDSVYDHYFLNKEINANTTWMRDPSLKIQRSQMDSLFKSESLTSGYYVIASIDQGVVNLSTWQKSKGTLQIHQVDMRSYFLLLLQEQSGQDIDDAIVKVGGRVVAFDHIMKGYKIDTKEPAIVELRKGDEQFFYKINKNKSYQNSSNNNNTSYHQNNLNVNGYLVTDRPVYKPGDTLRYKAYLLDGNTNKPYTDTLNVLIRGNRQMNIQKISPKAPGVYYQEFVIGDSIAPYPNYQLWLQNTKNGNYIAQNFKVEDYLLDETYLNVKTEQLPFYQRGDSMHLYAFAHNSNGLPLTDGQLEVWVIANDPGFKNGISLFVPDTLWHIKITSNPDGDTHIGIPGSIVPDVRSLRLNVKIQLSNSNFEQKESVQTLYFRDKSHYFKFEEEGDDLKVHLIKNKRSVSGKGQFQKGHHSKEAMAINFPFSTTVSEKDQYFVFTHLDDTGAALDSEAYNIQDRAPTIFEHYTKDTATFQINNAKKTLIRFIIYEGNEAIKEGVIGKDSLIRIKTNNDATVTMIYSYQQGGTLRSGTATAFKLNKKLNIDINKKDIIFPGQKDSIHLHLSDIDDKNVAHTNLTVLAYNANFSDDFVPRLSSKGVIKPGLKTPEYYVSLQQLNGGFSAKNLAIDKDLRKALELDKIFFYKDIFLSEKDMEIVHLKIDTTDPAQFAVYIKNGTGYEFPNYITENNRPLYVGMVDVSTDPNFIPISQGEKRLKVRSLNAIYNLPDIKFNKGYKTLIFIDPKKVAYRNEHKSTFYLSAQDMPDSLLTWEKEMLLNHTIQINNESYRDFLLKNNNNVFSCDAQYLDNNNYDDARYRKDNIVTVAPISYNSTIEYYQKGHFKTGFIGERGYQYALRPGMLRMKEASAYPAIAQKLRRNNLSLALQALVPPPIDLDTLEVFPAAIRQQREHTKTMYFSSTHAKNINTTATAKVSIITAKDQNIKGIIAIHHQQADSPVFSQQFYKTPATFKMGTGRYDLYIWWNDTLFSEIKNADIKTGGSNIFYVAPEAMNNSIPGAIVRFCTINYTKSRSEAGFTKWYDSAINRYVLRGVVVDTFGKAIRKAEVTLQNGATTLRAKTDHRGYFAFDKVLTTEQTLSVKKAGYKNYIVQIPSPSEKRGLDLSIVMEDKTSSASENIIEDLHEILNNTDLSNTKSGKRYSSYFNDHDPKYTSGSGISNFAGEGADQLLDGVAVYGSKIDKRNYTGALNTVSSKDIANRPNTSVTTELDGLAPGVYATGNGQPGTNPDIMIRGLASLSAPGPGPATSFKPSGPGPENTLNSDAGQAFITDFLNDMQAVSGMRNNFKDQAIWEPDLWTNSNGDASFTVRYPDNTNAWKTFVLAMNPDGYAATQITMTKAFKPLSASLNLPRFLRYGDTVEAIGKVINHSGQAFKLKTSFTGPDIETNTGFETIQNGKLEKYLFVAPSQNSSAETEISSSFKLQTENEYEDGEWRKIPILPVGAVERKGLFATMSNDTVIHSKASDINLPFTGNVSVRIEGSLLEVMLSEIEDLKLYPHGCTEQMTSKLLSIYYEEKVKQAMGNANFNNTATKAELLKKIAKAQNTDGSFGWFSGNSVDFRITNYVLSTFQKTNEPSFQPILNKGLAFLNYNLARAPQADRIAALSILSAAKYSSNYVQLLDQLDQKQLSDHDRFAIIKIKKEQNLPYRAALDSLIQQADSGASGMYWGAKSYDWYRNELATTALAFEILKDDSIYANRKPAVLRYLLSKRKNGYYGNTAESGLILSTLLPDLLKNDQNKYDNKFRTHVILSGSVVDTISNFPKMLTIKDEHAHFIVQKQGFSPVYFSVNYEYFDTKPKALNNGFKVSTNFLGKDDQSRLQQGERVTMRLSVEVKKNAEYVLIDIPIPAGCVPIGQNSKNYYESSRANFKDKISIYCGNLPKGIHHFDVPMQARYKGSFSINPATVSLMYFADESGHNEIKKVEIK